MHFKHTVITLCALLLSLLLSGCSPDPQKDITLFQPFIDANIDKVSNDPYISSTLKPGDKFYDILKSLQHGRHDKAETRLLELMGEGDVQAQYWYARLIYRSSVKETPIALRLLKSASDAGNPDALFSLSPWAAQCTVYFGERNCTDDNFNKAVEIFKERANQGDLRAQYFLLRMFKPDGSRIRQQYYFTGSSASLADDSYYLYHSDETRAFFIKEIIRFAESHYYQPLMDYVNLNLKWDYETRSYISPSESHRKLSLQLLEIAANHNYLPAIEKLVWMEDTPDAMKKRFIDKGMRLGSVSITTYMFFEHEQSDPERFYYDAILTALTGKTNQDIIKAPKQKAIKFEIKAKVWLNTLTPMIYIDEFTARNNWVD